MKSAASVESEGNQGSAWGHEGVNPIQTGRHHRNAPHRNTILPVKRHTSSHKFGFIQICQSRASPQPQQPPHPGFICNGESLPRSYRCPDPFPRHPDHSHLDQPQNAIPVISSISPNERILPKPRPSATEHFPTISPLAVLMST